MSKKKLIEIESTFFTKEFKSLFDSVFNLLSKKLEITPLQGNSYAQCLVNLQNLDVAKNIIETIFYITFPKYKSRKWYFPFNIPALNRTLIDIYFNTIILINGTNLGERLKWHEKALYIKSKKNLEKIEILNRIHPEFDFPVEKLRENVERKSKQFKIEFNNSPEKWPSIGDFVNENYGKIFGKQEYKNNKTRCDSLLLVPDEDFEIIKFLYEYRYQFDSSSIHATDLGLAERSTFIYNLLSESEKQKYTEEYYKPNLMIMLFETAIYTLLIISELHKEYYMEFHDEMSKIWSKMITYDKYAKHIYNIKYKDFFD